MTETTLPTTTPSLPTSSDVDKETERRNRRMTIIIGIAVVVLLVLIGLAVYGLTRNAGVTENIRDIFIIFMALESLVIGVALVVLIVQIASLINLLNNEIKPILDATNETIATLRGTTAFLSENVVEPVVKLNSYLAGLTKALELIGLKKK
jgi:ABC-type spermidine/putrescine transport system permease subunit II